MKNIETIEEFMQWLSKEGFIKTVKKHYPICKYILENNLNVGDKEILFITDLGYPTRRCSALLMGCYLLAAEELELNYKLVVQEPKSRGNEAEEQIVEALLDHGENNIIVLSLSGILGSLHMLGKSFRKYIKRKNHRFASTPSLSSMKSEKFPWLMKSLNVNYERMEKRGEPIKEILDNGSEVNMITRKGTDVTFDIKGMKSIINSGIYKQPGSGGNLPAGEVYLPPTSKGTNGTIIIDGSIKTKDTCILLEKPVTLTIKEGDVVNIKGNDAGLMLEQSLQWAARTAKFPWGVRRIGELGIGINPSARIIGPTIINEKALGTAHVAIGSNAWFGGTIFAKIHLDQVLHDPIIKVDGKLLRVDKELNTTKANNKQWHSNKSSW